MVKLLAVDIDGTLINYEQPDISVKDKEAIIKAGKKGVHVVLISGRNYYSMKRFLDDLSIKDYGITINGGIVIDMQNEEKILETYLDTDIAQGLTQIFEEEKVPYAIFGGLKAYAPKKHENHPTVEYLNIEKDNMVIYDDTREFLNTVKVNKYITMTDDKNLDRISSVIKSKYGDRVFVEYGFSGLVEIYPIGMNKGIALKNLADKLEISMDQVMAIGDAENDISMIEAAGIGVAMGNAVKNVKDHADYVSRTIEENGVAYAIEHFIL